MLPVLRSIAVLTLLSLGARVSTTDQNISAFKRTKAQPTIRDEHEQPVKLHGKIGQTTLLGRTLQLLPTKSGKFDWTLGAEARMLKEAYDADYAMFIYVRDSYSSDGRVALQIVAALLFAVAIPGGQQVGFASLVDLDTGDVV